MTDPDFIKGGFVDVPKKTLDIIAVGTGKGRSMLPSLTELELPEELQVSYEEAHVEEIQQIIRDDLIKELKEQHNEQMTDVLYSEFGEDL